MSQAPLHDSGLPAERTSLAWRRTVLASILGTALVSFTAERIGNLLVVVGGAGLALAIAVAVIWHVRRPFAVRTAPWPVLVLAAGTVVALAVLGVANSAYSILERS